MAVVHDQPSSPNPTLVGRETEQIAIARIGEQLPQAGICLDNTLKTGTY
jgi:hypothetical protein